MSKENLTSIQLTKDFKKELAQMKLDGDFDTYEELIKNLILKAHNNTSDILKSLESDY